MKKFLIAVLALALVGGLKTGSVEAATLRTAQKGASYFETLTTSDNTATDIFNLKTESNKVYHVDITVLARGQAGTDQGKGKDQECFVEFQNLAGTVTAGTATCQTATGALTIGAVAAAVTSTTARITVAGASSQTIGWVAQVKVLVNDAPNVTTTTSTTSTSTSSSTSTSTTT